MSKKKVRIGSLLSCHKKIAGSWIPPPDKSLTHRAFFLASLSPKESKIKNPLLSGDCISTLNAFKSLGVPIRKKGELIFFARGKKSETSSLRKLLPPKKRIDCGNSGTTMRLLCGVLAAQNFKSTLVGDGSLSKRPMRRVIEPLSKMGARITARKGNFAPLKIDGNPNSDAICWRTEVSSAQVKSCLLLAGLFLRGSTTVEEPGKSRDHTERMLQNLGANIKFSKERSSIAILGRHSGESRNPVLASKNKVTLYGPSHLKGLNFTVPGDFSSAAFGIAAALIVPGSRLVVRNVNLNPTRTGFLSVLKRMGAKFKILAVKNRMGEPIGTVEVEHSSLHGTEVYPREIPYLIDEIPILAVVATQANGKTTIRGAEELRVKESDRISAVVSNLTALGAHVQERSDGMVIHGSTPLYGRKVSSYGDHRIAMSMAVAALIAEGKTEIEDFDCARISFPNFLKELKGLIH